MSAEYEIWLLNPTDGTPLATLAEFGSLDYTKIQNGTGAFSLLLPVSLDFSLIQEDTRIAVFRKPDGGIKSLDFCGLVRYIERSTRGHSQYRTVAGPDLNDLLATRIIAYAATTAYADKTGHADDVMKAYVRENMGALVVDTWRDLSDYGFTVAVDTALGTTLSKSAPWRNLLETCKEIADASHSTEATSVYFGIVPLDTGWDCEFRTSIQQWGQDRRNQVIFGLEWGNITDITRNINYRDEKTFAYAGGPGEGTARTIKWAVDSARCFKSPFNRREVFADARNGDSDASIEAEALAAVKDGCPKTLFSGSIVNVGNYVYGRDYGLGDYVTAVFEKEVIDCRIESVHITAQGAKETVDIQVRKEDSSSLSTG